MEFNFVTGEPALDVSTIGQLAPVTTPAALARARYMMDLANIFPEFKSGTISTSAFPATFDEIFLWTAASGLIALSKANGPSNEAWAALSICPRSACALSAQHCYSLALPD